MDSKSETKYERLRKIGIGSYGVVFKCANRQTGQIVAIKRYSENDTDPIIRKIAMREVRMLRQLKHPNLIHLIEVFRRKRILHLVFDYCELTVLDVIDKYANNCPLNLIKKIIWQLVNGVSHCHAHNCIHRDIKPENILINQAGVVKLCDFGFARNLNPAQSNRSVTSTSAKQIKYEREARLLGVSTGQMVQFMASNGSGGGGGGAGSGGTNKVDQQQQANYEKNKENQQSERQALTEYVATRWYRAPELLVGDVYYDKKIDIWAIGCVTAELMRGEPMWPGKTDLDQLCMIKNSLGPLTASQTHTLLTQGLYDQVNMERLLSQSSLTEPLERKLPTRIGQTGFEFVLVCLQMDPTKRPTCDELLQHEYIKSAQMTQFVRGTSHAASTGLAATTDQVNLTAASNRGMTLIEQSGRVSRSLLGKSQAASGTPSRRGGSVHPNQNAVVGRSNSQAILMIANNQNQNQQQQQQQQQPPAYKRLVIASDSGLMASPTNYQSSPKHLGGSLVPVPVRSIGRQTSGMPTATTKTTATTTANSPAGWLNDDSMNQQQARQQYKRKVPQATGNRSITVGQSLGATGKIRPHEPSAGLKSTGATTTDYNQMYNQRGTPSVDIGSASNGRRRLSQSNTNLYRSSVGDIEPTTTNRNQHGKLKGTARVDRQQTNNFGHTTANTNTNNNVGQQQQQQAKNRTQFRINEAIAGYGNTNSSASSSSPTSTSFGTSGKSSSISFLPTVQQ